MPRPCRMRRVGVFPNATYFKPAGVPLRMLEEIILALDEVEAMRLADFEGLYQEEAGERMGVSRATFARVIESARRKVADALIHGKALRIEGGAISAPVPPVGHRGGCGRGRRWGRGPMPKDVES